MVNELFILFKVRFLESSTKCVYPKLNHHICSFHFAMLSGHFIHTLCWVGHIWDIWARLVFPLPHLLSSVNQLLNECTQSASFCYLSGLRCKQNFLGVWGRGGRAIISHAEYVSWSEESLSIIDFTKNESSYIWNWLHQRTYSVQTQHFYICIIYFPLLLLIYSTFFFLKNQFFHTF